MFSILPGVTAIVFLALGLFVVKRKGWTRVSASFLFLCVTTFFWQSTWAVLFQVKDPDAASLLVTLGYLFILFLPTSIYQFLSEISETRSERRYVYSSYGFSGFLAIVLVTTNDFVSGYYDYFWGYYPKAGTLHFLHVLQTSVVVARGLYITWLAARQANHFQRTRLNACVVAMLIYFFAALDYLCNYGIEFYPPGVIFILVSFSIITVAIVRYGLMDNPAALAASIAHEMRTPLATIQLQARSISKLIPELYRGYQLAVDHQLCEPLIRPRHMEKLRSVADDIQSEVRQSHAIIDITLASANGGFSKSYDLEPNSMSESVLSAVSSYPFVGGERKCLELSVDHDFDYIGSGSLMRYVIYNLIKNSLYAIQSARKGGVHILLSQDGGRNTLVFTDTGPGISADVLPHVFDDFFTTKREGAGTGMGLAFCRRVLISFGATITCQSVVGDFTRFTLSFPPVDVQKHQQEETGRESVLSGTARA
jgi:signal transduction histidine kinase